MFDRHRQRLRDPCLEMSERDIFDLELALRPSLRSAFKRTLGVPPPVSRRPWGSSDGTSGPPQEGKARGLGRRPRPLDLQ